MRRLALAAVVVAALFPAEASAQFFGPFQFPSEDYGPGITVSGAGFAPVGQRDRATARAVGDARRRAEAIAGALDVALGELRTAEVSTPFEPRRQCSNPESPRCSKLDAVSVETTFAIVGGPTSDEDARELDRNRHRPGPRRGGPPDEPVDQASAPRRTLAATPTAAEAAAANARAAASATGDAGRTAVLRGRGSELLRLRPGPGHARPGRFCGSSRGRSSVRIPTPGASGACAASEAPLLQAAERDGAARGDVPGRVSPRGVAPGAANDGH